MAIQMRRGNFANYDEDKMLPGEFGVATDEEELYIAFATGNSKRVLTEDDLETGTVQGIWTGTCETVHNSSAKIVTLDNSDGFSLADGTIIVVNFVYGNESSNPTLDVNNTGAKNIVYQGSVAPAGTVMRSIAPYYQFGIGVKAFVYKNSVTTEGSSGYWVMMAPDFRHICYLMDNKANNNSPTFTGSPKAPTASAGTSTTQIATTAFVQNALPTGLTATDQGSGVVALSIT